jgi:hypothetical protein
MGDVENNPAPIERTIKRLANRYDRLHLCFEAGPTGYGLCRQVQVLGHDCMVVAPALIPKRAGERIKTNRRNAGASFIERVSLRESGRPIRLMRLSGILRGLARPRRTTFDESTSSFSLSSSGIAGFTGAAATGRWRIGAGSPARSSIMLRSRSSFRKGSTRSKTHFSACVASRSNSPSSCRSGPWHRWWKPIKPCAAHRFSSP